MLPLFAAAQGLPWVKPALIVVALCAVFMGGWSARGVVANRDVARLEAQAERVRADHAAALGAAERRTRAMQDAVADDIAEGVSHERKRAQAAERRAADLDAVRRRLLDASIRPACGAVAADPVAGPAGGGAAAAGPGLVLAELYRRVDDEAAELARYADAAAAAGRLCERAYGSAQARLRQP